MKAWLRREGMKAWLRCEGMKTWLRREGMKAWLRPCLNECSITEQRAGHGQNDSTLTCILSLRPRYQKPQEGCNSGCGCKHPVCALFAVGFTYAESIQRNCVRGWTHGCMHEVAAQSASQRSSKPAHT
eukprot:351486-Chlamydomonas_euryale.AAC.9